MLFIAYFINSQKEEIINLYNLSLTILREILLVKLKINEIQNHINILCTLE